MQESNKTEMILEYIEKNNLIKDAINVVHNNDDDFNYEFIEGQLLFKDNIVYFIDTDEILQESSMEDVHAFPLGVYDVAPYKKDYEKHPNDYEYLLCRYKNKFWLSVIRHSQEETLPERFAESTLSVIREYLNCIQIQDVQEMLDLISSTKDIIRNRELKYSNQKRTFRLMPRKVNGIVVHGKK